MCCSKKKIGLYINVDILASIVFDIESCVDVHENETEPVQSTLFLAFSPSIEILCEPQRQGAVASKLPNSPQLS